MTHILDANFPILSLTLEELHKFTILTTFKFKILFSVKCLYYNFLDKYNFM
jgi:hypothetical protein